MKILNEKRRILGIINPVDLFVLLAVMAVVGGVLWKTAAEPAMTAEVPMTKVTYTVRTRGITKRTLEEIRRQKDFDPRLFTDEGFVPDAQIVSIDTDVSSQEIITDAGEVITVIDEKRVDVVFTIEASVPKNVIPIKVGPQVVKTGLTHIVKTRRLDYQGTIETVVPHE